MASEVEVKIWCDHHLEQGVKEPGHPIKPIKVGGKMPRVMDLCDPCEKEFVEPLLQLLEEHGRTLTDDTPNSTPAAAKPRGKFVCPDPECDEHNRANPWSNHHSLAKHSRDVHEMPMSKLVRKFSGDNTDDDDAYTCDICSRDMGSPQGLGAHKRSKHGIIGATSPENLANVG